MYLKLACLFQLSLLACVTISAQNVQTGYNITVEISAIRNNQGIIKIGLFCGEDGFPGKPAKAITGQNVAIENGKARASFKNIPPGSYAIAAFHDENSDGKINSNFIGVPKEGFGVSNNAKAKFGPPKYHEAMFTLKNSSLIVRINIVYL